MKQLRGMLSKPRELSEVVVGDVELDLLAVLEDFERNVCFSLLDGPAKANF